MTFEQIEKLISAGFTKDDILKLFGSQETKKEEPEKKEESKNVPPKEEPEKKDEVEPWKQAFAAMSQSISALTESVQAMQKKGIDSDEMPDRKTETVDDIISYMFRVEDKKE